MRVFLCLCLCLYLCVCLRGCVWTCVSMWVILGVYIWFSRCILWACVCLCVCMRFPRCIWYLWAWCLCPHSSTCDYACQVSSLFLFICSCMCLFVHECFYNDMSLNFYVLCKFIHVCLQAHVCVPMNVSGKYTIYEPSGGLRMKQSLLLV